MRLTALTVTSSPPTQKKKTKKQNIVMNEVTRSASYEVANISLFTDVINAKVLVAITDWR
jgi:hypothetical protein